MDLSDFELITYVVILSYGRLSKNTGETLAVPLVLRIYAGPVSWTFLRGHGAAAAAISGF